MNDMLVSLAPTTTILEFLTIFVSDNILLVVKQRPNGDSYSSKGSLLDPSTLFLTSSSYFFWVSSDTNLSWSHFLSRRCGNLLLLMWTNSLNMLGIIVSCFTSKYKHVFWVNLRSSFSMNLVDFSKIGLMHENINLVWLFLSYSAIRI